MNLNIVNIYYLLMSVLILISIFLLLSAFESSKNIKSQIRIIKLWRQTLDSFADSNVDEIFERVGIKLSVRKYSAYRNLITITLSIMVFANFLLTSDINLTVKKLLIITVLYLITTPKKQIIKGKKSPFQMFFDMRYKNRQVSLERDLINMIIQMQNLILSNENTSISSDYLLTRLIPYTKISKPIFLQVQAFFMVGRRMEAAEYLKKNFNTRIANNFSQILIKLDTLEPKEFIAQLDGISKEIEEKEQTRRAYIQQRKKTKIFIAASLEIVMLFMIFGYVVMMNTISALSQL